VMGGGEPSGGPGDVVEDVVHLLLGHAAVGLGGHEQQPLVLGGAGPCRGGGADEREGGRNPPNPKMGYPPPPLGGVRERGGTNPSLHRRKYTGGHR